MEVTGRRDLRSAAKGTTEAPKSSSSRSGRCFKCGSPEHLQRECPKNNSRDGMGLMADDGNNQQENPVYDTHGEEQEDEVELEGDMGPMLVMERALVSRSKNDEDWHRQSLFHTQCTIGGKVCHIIIDNGSWQNTISEDAVNKLGLEKIKHSHPYSMRWFKSDKVSKVNFRCLVSFSIGNKFLIRLNVMWLIWMLVISLRGDHGSMIDLPCMMATSTHILS